MTVKLGVPEIEGAQPRIAIVGIGGGGCNGINSMMQDGMPGVSFIACDTDGQHLAQTSADWRIQLGRDATGGYGAGTDPAVGREAAEESVDNVRAALSGMSLAFLTAGMGGGTGSGALPVMARQLREMDILTVGVVTKPFTYEGSKRMEVAVESIKESAEYLDTLLVISNQNLFQAEPKKITLANALSRVDGVLHESVRGMVDLVVRPGIINMDFADLCMALRDGGVSVIGMGEATGPNRATEAALAAARNPLLDGTTMDGAKALLVNVAGGGDLELKDVDDAANLLRGKAHVQARVKVGAASDADLEGRVRVYVIATGISWRAGKFDAGKKGASRPTAAPPSQPARAAQQTPASSPTPVPGPAASRPQSPVSAPVAETAPEPTPAVARDARPPTVREMKQPADAGLWGDTVSIDPGSVARPPAAAAKRQESVAPNRAKPRPANVVPLGGRVQLGTSPPAKAAQEEEADAGDRPQTAPAGDRPQTAPAGDRHPARYPTDTGKGLLSRILSTG